MYWFNLFRNTLAFPTLDKKFEEIKELSSESIEKIRKIQDKETLYEIIDHLKSQDSDDVPLIDSFQYTYERAPKVEKLKENYLKLALILTVMYNGYQFSYLKDHVVISLKKKNKGNQDKFICPLPTFCMLILFSNAQENLPFDKKHSDDLFVAPYISSETVKKVKKKKKKSKAYDSDDSILPPLKMMTDQIFN
ncbi:predicted protein [Naegleria gruberi]|uniref:Predicted protein n=1 Tax=Naegleria gruberi TaxID=5762 RepID=D2W3C6_NAEGR|nr:uncharacterized protein NAEGRDRAFT_75898 [Naegleria gruberi]EFC36394.1 predicted protein [Naegleria gruberi]|eukprot:XP_002669138.1 predicted protein [Naegleria gruberi strain NEG-M]